MPQEPTHGGLFSRIIGRHKPISPAQAQGQDVRPCLPAVERLDDRILLSAAPQAAPDASSEGGGPTQVLIGLIKGELSLTENQLSFMKLSDQLGSVQKDKWSAIGGEFLNIEDALMKYGDNLITDGASDKALSDVQLKLDDAFQKIDGFISDLGPGAADQLLPAVQRIQDQANGLVAGLTDLAGSPIQHKELGGQLLKITDDFMKIDDLAFSWGLSQLSIGNSDKFDHKFDSIVPAVQDVFLKINDVISNISDVQIKQDIASAVYTLEADTIKFIDSFGPGGTTT